MIRPSSNTSGRPARVAIVGGGPGGLLTAYFLQREAVRPVRTTIFEATPRLGGKILTPTFSAAPIRYEAGAAEFYDYSPVGEDPLRNLVAELGLPTAPLSGASVMQGDAALANLDDITTHLGSAARRELEAFDLAARCRMTPRDFYAADEAWPQEPESFTAALARIRVPAVRRYVETLIHSDLATEPDCTSECYGLQNYLMNDPAYMRLYCIAGGNDQLIAALRARIDATFQVSQPVTRIATQPGGRLVLTSRGADGAREEEFDAVVLALPLQHLEGIECTDPRLAAAMRAHCAHHDHPAHYLRISVLFDEPFWKGRIDGSYVMLDAFDGCCLYDESSREPGLRHGVLGWLLGGDAAAQLSPLDDDTLVARAVASLPASLSAHASSILETRIHRWRGAVSALPGGWRPRGIDRRHQPEPVAHPHVFVVGDYLFDSTLNGVLDSAEHVAGWLAATLAA